MKATNRSFYETVAKQDFYANGWVNFSAEPVPVWEDALLACFLFVFLNSQSAANSHVLAFRIKSPQRRYPQKNKSCRRLCLRFNIKSYLRHHTVYCSACETASPCCPSSLPNSNLRTQPSWMRRHLSVTPVNSLCSPFQLCCHIPSSSWESDPATQREKSWPVGTDWHASEKGSSSSVGNGLCLAHTGGSL